MRVRDIIRRAAGSLRQAKARTLLTSLAIAVGAFTITLALAAGEGGRQYAEKLVSANADERTVQVSQKQDTQSDPSQPKEYSEDPTRTFGDGYSVKLLKQEDIEKLKNVEGVASVSPIYSVDVLYATREGEKKYQANVRTLNPSITADYLAGSADNLADDEVVLPHNFRESLGFESDEAAIGKKVQLAVQEGGSFTPETKTFTYTIAAVAKPSSFALLATPAFELTTEAMKELYTYNKQGTPDFESYFSANVRAEEGVAAETLKQRIVAEGYQAETARDARSTLFDFINVLQGILIGFGALAVLTSVFGIINTQYISVLERTQQIGLMKALGMRRRDVGRLFKFEAAWIGFLGGAIGAGLAIILGVLFNPWISEAISLGDGSRLLVFDPVSTVVVVGGLMLVSVTAGILPARKAAKLNPIEALRTE